MTCSFRGMEGQLTVQMFARISWKYFLGTRTRFRNFQEKAGKLYEKGPKVSNTFFSSLFRVFLTFFCERVRLSRLLFDLSKYMPWFRHDFRVDWNQEHCSRPRLIFSSFVLYHFDYIDSFCCELWENSMSYLSYLCMWFLMIMVCGSYWVLK